MIPTINWTARAIQSLRPGAQWSMSGETLEWLDANQSQPTEQEIQDKIQELQQQDLLNQYQRAVEAHIESVAKSKDYSSSTSLASYALSTNSTWASEAQAFIAWRDEVWDIVYVALDTWKQTGVQPSIEELINSLPQIQWIEE